MKISIITAVLNAVDTIEDTIISVASQRHDDIEHIIIDGGSTDGTQEIIRNHRGQIAMMISEPDNGIYYAMNKGIALATGEIVGLLNADDVFIDNEVLGKVVLAFLDPSIGACHSDLIYVDRHDTNRIIRYWKSRPYEDGLFERGWLPAHPTFFLRRNYYQKFGGFDTRYRYQADFELTLRMLAVNKIPSIYIPEILVKMRMGGASNNNMLNILRGNIEAYRACRQYGLSISPLFIAKKIISRIPQFILRPERS